VAAEPPAPEDEAVALTRELLRRVRRLEIRTSRVADDLFAGSYKSVFKGRGIEFSEVRRYYPGDEVRDIEWNVTARTGYPHVKQHVDERELTVMLVVDASGSVEFGSVDRSKQDVAVEVAGLLAFSAIRNNDKVGLVMFTEEVEKYIAPDKGRRQVLRLIREMLHHQPQKRGTNIAEAMDLRPVSVAAKRHDLIAVRLIDPRERGMPRAGIVEFYDAEAGQHVLIDTSRPEFGKAFEQRTARKRETETSDLVRRGVDVIDVHTDESAIEPLVRFFELRARRIA
jgi:uncharacterized protein (DUF58 family)